VALRAGPNPVTVAIDSDTPMNATIRTGTVTRMEIQIRDVELRGYPTNTDVLVCFSYAQQGTPPNSLLGCRLMRSGYHHHVSVPEQAREGFRAWGVLLTDLAASEPFEEESE